MEALNFSLSLFLNGSFDFRGIDSILKDGPAISICSMKDLLGGLLVFLLINFSLFLTILH